MGKLVATEAVGVWITAGHLTLGQGLRLASAVTDDFIGFGVATPSLTRTDNSAAWRVGHHGSAPRVGRGES